ncbi:MAG: DNA-directed RNA polymerase subunit beta [Gammaproteobacteria bacterium]|nr:DNA-directed RNA polymerase subunit beta [Gammaproteobacteria bacterium]
MPQKSMANKVFRKKFGKFEEMIKIPHLLEMQIQSFDQFLQRDSLPDQRENIGLEAELRSVFPLVSHNRAVRMVYLGYRFEEAPFSVEECQIRNMIYGAPLRLNLRLEIYDRDHTQPRAKIVEMREQEVYLGDMPLMTSDGVFVINGTDRVVVSQLHRSPGVIFEHDKGKGHSSGRLMFSSRIIPARGSWIDMEFDIKDCIYTRIDRHRKLPVTVLLYAMKMSTEDIIEAFYEPLNIEYLPKKKEYVLRNTLDSLVNEVLTFDIIHNGKTIVENGRRITPAHIETLKKLKLSRLSVPVEWLNTQRLFKDIAKDENFMLAHCNAQATEEVRQTLIENGVVKFSVLFTNNLNRGPYISQTLTISPVDSEIPALVEFYRIMRPGEPPTHDFMNKLFHDLFSNPDRYDLSAVGRMKFNKRLGLDREGRTLSRDDIIAVLRTLIKIKDGNEKIDDIDHLKNRRVRSVGEIFRDPIRTGLYRIATVVRDRLSSPDIDKFSPQDLINSRPVSSAIKEFFNSNQLSQFMDQNNPLSEITHKRRISAIGPGGLTRDRAGFEVRDVHPSHYGRVCPIESPEGQNIGLINSLAVYARANSYGFLETPYRRVKDGAVTDEVSYLSALEEGQYYIAQANTEVDDDGHIVKDFSVARFENEFVSAHRDKIEYMDISPAQIVSVAAALIPFLEHDDANRALMGSNMQRQAVPLIRNEMPLVGTGFEKLVATDSGAAAIAKRAGVVESADASSIVIKSQGADEGGQVDIYSLVRYKRTNQNTCLNSRTLVKPGDKVEKGEVLADGMATDRGELALGQNVLVGFMSWDGYNFEDSILVSERVVSEDRFTSIHIEELTCTARDTTLGPEEITADIPNVTESALRMLDASGIVQVGSEVKSGDILVGMITPKGETSLSSEEKLLFSIFGAKASNVKNSSLRVPSGMQGTVIDVKVFVRGGEKLDDRTKDIKNREIGRVESALRKEYDIQREDLLQRVSKVLVGQITRKARAKKLSANTKITPEVLEALGEDQWLKLEVKDIKAAARIKDLDKQHARLEERLKKGLTKAEERVSMGDNLQPNVLRIVKVSLAVKRRLQAGDKMAGRHGNKGVISNIVPVEDMPHLEDGTPLDVILNPLGVPSRMNVGQLLEIHLGWASKGLGKQIGTLIDQMDKKSKTDELHKFVSQIYGSGETDNSGILFDKDGGAGEHFVTNCSTLRRGVPMMSPVFDGASEDEIKQLLRLAGLDESGKSWLYDGRNGERFDQKVAVGYMYMLKLNHLVDDKMHARSTGSYSLVTQQPLGGKAQFGGQRFGEMEVWALEAYGAAHALQEMLTVKSDDVGGRNRIFKNIINSNFSAQPKVPESFNVLIKELRSLCINITTHKDKPEVAELPSPTPPAPPAEE